MQIINGQEVVCMQMSELTLGFIASCIAGKLPSLGNIPSDVDKKSLKNHVEICFEEAMKRWCSSSIVRERIAQRKFPTIGQLQVCYAGEDWKHYKYAVKIFVKAWADELEKDFDCVKYIQQFDATESEEQLELLIAFLGEEPSSEKPATGGRGRIWHEPVSGYIRRYCTSDHSDSDFLFYALGKKERHILADYVVGLECFPTNKYILYSSAQTGKTTDLKELCWELQESGLYIPFSYEVRNNTKLKRENLPVCKYYGEKEVVVVIDALDEVNGQKYEDLIEEIGGYAYDHPEMKVLLSCRSNYRRERQLEIFKDLYLEELGGGDAQAHIDKQLGKAKGRKLTKLIIENQLHDFAKNPFFLNVLIDAYKADSSKLPRTKAEIYQLFIEDSYRKEKQGKNVQTVTYHNFDESVFLLERVALGMSLMNVQTLNRDEMKVCLKSDDANLEECLRYDLLQKEDEERYSFKHNSFREWLVAHYLSREGLDKAKQMATHPNGRIKPEWYNIIMLWVTMYGKDQKKEVLAILDWLKNASLDLVIYIDRNMLDENVRTNVFKGLLLEYKSLGIRIANILSQDYTDLLDFGQSEDTLAFLADEVAASEVGTAYYADLMCLCYFLDWSVWEKRNRDLTEKLFVALEKKTKEALKTESSHDLSFLYFDNKFFTRADYLNRIYVIVKDSNHYEAIKSMIRLVDLADAVDDYLDYILEKEGYVHNQQDGTTTLVVSRTCIFTALSKVKSRNGVVKVLQHRFFGSRYAHSDEQEEYGKMMTAILGQVCKYIKDGDEELVETLENYYVGLFKDYHYQFDRDQHGQVLLQEFRTCYVNAGLREKGRDVFNARTGEIFRPRDDKEPKWDELHQIFSLAALWMTAEDVQADFGKMDSANEYDWAKAGWYREIPIPELAEYASRLLDEKFPKPDRNTGGRERRIKSFQDFAEYAVFKQIVLEMVSGMDEHTTRRAYGKRLRELEEGYNLYAFRFFLHYPKGEEHYDTDEIIKGIKNRDVYESFFMKEIVGMLEHPDPDLTISEDIVVRCRETAKNNVLKICEGKYPVFFYEDSLKQMLKGEFEIPTEKLVNLLDYGFIHISKKDEDNFFSREYSVFDYITEHVGEEQLSPLIVERLKKCVDKEDSRLSYPFAKYIVENGVEEGYDLALRFAFAGFSMSSNILEMLVKNGIKIEEIKAGTADMPVSDRLYCYLFLSRDAGQGDWVKQRLEAEFKTFEGYTLKRAVQQLLSMGSLEALDYLSSHTDIIRDGDDFHFTFDDTNAVPSLCYFIEYNDKHKMDAHFMLNSILTSLERIAIKDKDSLFEVKNELGLLTQKGKQFQYLNRYIIAFEDKYYAAYSGIGDIKEAMKMVDEDEVVDEEWPEEEFVYISYNWESTSSVTVNYLCDVLKDNNIPYKRDREDCNYMDNIMEFMNAIRNGKTVIVVFGLRYMKSVNCMYELSGIMEHPDYVKRILPVVVDDAVRRTSFYISLAKHWKKKKDDKEKEVAKLKAIDAFLAEPEEKKLKEIEAIYKILPVIKDYIDWTNTENLNALCSSRFSSIIRKIRNGR